jgi:hypothetical protein
LLWLLLLIALLIVLSVLFGGFQRGTKTGGLGVGAGSASSSSATTWL